MSIIQLRSRIEIEVFKEKQSNLLKQKMNITTDSVSSVPSESSKCNSLRDRVSIKLIFMGIVLLMLLIIIYHLGHFAMHLLLQSCSYFLLNIVVLLRETNV